MKEQGGIRDLNKNYNEIIDGHGTGYAPPSEEDYENLIGKISILNVIPETEKSFSYKASKDLSSDPSFPIIGDQEYQGSCTSWANVYYAYGYLEAKDNGWYANSGNPDYLLSPAWSYNKLAAADYGSMPVETGELIKEWGVATLSTMPYDDSDVDNWGDETAWREAPYHRPLEFSLIDYVGPSTIDTIKDMIDSGTPVTIGIDAYQFYNGLDDNAGDYILSSGDYKEGYSLNHAQCFVGYDDEITEGSDVGAFRVVNSWGDWMDGGYYWLTYDAFNEFGGVPNQYIGFFTDRIAYKPSLIATWEFSSAPTRMDDIITLGVGPYGAALDSIIPQYEYDPYNFFPNFMALDISEFQTYYDENDKVNFYLEIGQSYTPGTISSFYVERYISGVFQEITPESIDVPKTTPGYVNALFKELEHELKVKLEVPIFPESGNSYEVNATVINVGINTENGVELYLLLDQMPVASTIIDLLPDEEETINYMWTPTEDGTYNFTAYAPPIPDEYYESNNEVTELVKVVKIIFKEDFEGGLSKWESITGLWHLTDNTGPCPYPYYSPTHSMWFGQELTGDYDTGFREMGNVTSLPIDLLNEDVAYLQFHQWREVEEFSDYDLSYVYISTDNVNWDLLYMDYRNRLPWIENTINISLYCGYSSVRIRFYFDTIDDAANDYIGWLIDDVTVFSGPVDFPKLQYYSHIIDDDASGGSSGNGNGYAEAGEEIELRVTLENLGSKCATYVWAYLSTADSLITITDDTENYPDIPPGLTGECYADYDFDIDPSHGSGFITFTLDIYSDEGYCMDTFDIYIYIIGEIDDNYEENDDYMEACNISSEERTWLSSINGPGIQADDDWYEIYIDPGYERLIVELLFTDAEGDINLAVFNSSLNLIAYSNSKTDNEYINCVVPSSGTYYLLVYFNNTGNCYDLKWDDVSIDMMVLFEEDFEKGLSKWEEITGLWHLTNTSSFWPNPCHSPTHSMWFGQEVTGNYDTVERVYGQIMSIPIDLSDIEVAYLEFYHWKEVEELYGFDMSYVLIYNGSYNLIYESYENVDSWESVIIDISDFCGSSSIQILFYFDTDDEESNDYRGWLVDDVSVYSYEPESKSDDDDGENDDDDGDDGGGGGGGGGGDGGGRGGSDDIVGGIVNYLGSPIGLITIGGITGAGVAVIAVVWYFTKRKIR